MAPWVYTPLPEGSVRLLRLLPHADENYRIECQVFAYPLLNSGNTHPYEALSYVWESADDPRLLFINDSELSVKGNLHAALSHLRDPFIERILWVDAICINQKDDEEKGRQVRLMAKIYAKANRVIVWLGKAADNSDHALIALRKAAEEQYTHSATGETTTQGAISRPSGDQTTNSAANETQQAILKLLERPWFQRIWVLQEAAAARSTLIKCGRIEIDGQAFCAGVDASELSYNTRPDLQGLIPQVVYLIRGAAFRPRQEITSSSGGLSLGIRPLGELVDMYQTRKATIPLDKVYALLGMSSDDPYTAGLVADYKSSWKDLFQKLIRFCFSHQTSVSTWNGNEVAVIEAKGDIIGEISSTREDTSRHDRRHVEITWDALSHSGVEGQQSSRFTFQTSANVIKKGDVVCLLQGASAPTIIRPCRGFSIIIMVAVPLADHLLKQKASTTKYRHDLLLVWDWDLSRGEQHDKDYEYFMSTRGVPKCSVAACDCLGALDKAMRSWNFGLLLNRLERYGEAAKHLRSAVELCRIGRSLRSVEEAYPSHSGWREADTETLKVLDDLLIDDKGAILETNCIKYRRTPLLWAAQAGQEAVVWWLLEAGAATDAKDGNGRKSLSWTFQEGDEGVTCRLLEADAAIEAKDVNGQASLSLAAMGGHGAIVQLPLATGKADTDSKDRYDRTPLSYAAANGHGAVVQLLLAIGKANTDSKDGYNRTPLLYAAANGYDAVVQLLLAIGKADTDSKDTKGRTPLSYAAANGHDAVVQLLLTTKKADADSKDTKSRTPLSHTAANGHGAVVQLLLAIGVNVDSRDTQGRTPLSYAAANGHEAVVQLLLAIKTADADAKGGNGRTPLSYAAADGHDAVVQLLLAIGVNADSKDAKGRTPLSYAAANGYKAVVQLLLATGKVDANSKSTNGVTPLSGATRSGHRAVIRLLEERLKGEEGREEKKGLEAGLLEM